MCGRGATEELRIDAHHIMERRLFVAPAELGGYFLDNGATLCDDGTLNSCHLKAEATLISCEAIRKAAGITNIILPEAIYADLPLDKWGNPIEPTGQRMRGPLFNDESVQKILAAGDVLKLFTWKVRHPRTYHLPYSPLALAGGITDDKVMYDLSQMKGERVIGTVKMDGSQCTLYRDYLHGRTPDFKSNPTWTWLQNFHASFSHWIEEGFRINVENLWGAVTTDIQYHHLTSKAQAFMVWNRENECLSWDDTVEYLNVLSALIRDVTWDRGEKRGQSKYPTGLPHPPVVYDDLYDEAKIRGLMKMTHYNGDEMEGVVVRVARKFQYGEFATCVGKMVRASHQVRHSGELRLNRVEGEER